MPEYRRFVLNEPPAWGSAEMPLLPSEWAADLRTHVVHGVHRTAGRRRAEVPLDAFCIRDWSAGLTVDAAAGSPTSRRPRRRPGMPGGPFAGVRAPVLDCLRTWMTSAGDCVHRPLFTKRVAGGAHVLGIPVLVGTRRRLRRAGLLGADLADFLSAATFRELRHALGSLSSALDLWMTARAWLVDLGDGMLRALPSVIPDTVLEAFRLARVRNFRQLGVLPTSIHYSLEMAEAMGRRAGLSADGPATLEEAASCVGLSKQRVQQLEKTFAGLSAARCWGVPEAIAPLLGKVKRRLRTCDYFRGLTTTHIDGLAAGGVAALLTFHGARVPSHSKVSRRLDALLATAGKAQSEVVDAAYASTGRFGFIREDDLRRDLRGLLPAACAEDIEVLAFELAGRRRLPLGYLHIDSRRHSWFVTRARYILRRIGTTSLDEVYEALSRNRVYCRRPPLPPRSVVRAFFEQDRRFRVQGDDVSLHRSSPRPLSRLAAWMAAQIAATGLQVIHRTRLLANARAAGRKSSTVSTYCQYSPLFKPVGRGCVALVGTFPDDEAISLANEDARAIRVASRLKEWHPKGNTIELKVRVGNDMIDSGILGVPKAIKQLLESKNLAIVSDDIPYGNAGLSGSSLYGLTTVCAALGIVPRDIIDIRIDLETNELCVEPATAGEPDPHPAV